MKNILRYRGALGIFQYIGYIVFAVFLGVLAPMLTMMIASAINHSIGDPQVNPDDIRFQWIIGIAILLAIIEVLLALWISYASSARYYRGLGMKRAGLLALFWWTQIPLFVSLTIHLFGQSSDEVAERAWEIERTIHAKSK